MLHLDLGDGTWGPTSWLPQLQLMIDDAVILKMQHLVEACDGVMYSDDDVSHGDLFQKQADLKFGDGDGHGNLWKNDEYLGRLDNLKWDEGEEGCLQIQMQKQGHDVAA